MFALSCFYHRWKFGHIGCYIYGLLGMQFGDANILTLAVISLLRLLTYDYFNCLTFSSLPFLSFFLGFSLVILIFIYEQCTDIEVYSIDLSEA